ncbi:hypothetical protein PENSPDRAFT_754952 [Peniophora sp. CONT]|nr:hypothetical protein PENSPDRAFT_754952 [Peniophora sp. CONT]
MSVNDVAWDEASYAQQSEDAWSAFIQSRFEALATRKLTIGPSVQSRMLEQELTMLRKYTRVAFQCRNAVSGAGALPAEVLATIFGLAQTGWPAYSAVRKGKTRYNLGWIRITHVCSLWRRTALRTPALWTRIPCPHLPPHMIPHIIRRSGSMKLKLHVDTGSFSDQDVPFEGWLSEPILRRSELVVICSSSLEETSSAMRCLSFAKETLKELTVDLDIADCDGWQLIETDDGAYDLTGFPALRRVSLRGCYPDWNESLPLPFPNGLTHLTLAVDKIYDNMDLSFRPDAPRFRDALAALPSLTELTLENFFPIPPLDFAADSVVYIPLPSPFFMRQLQKLTVTCTCFTAYLDYWYFWTNFKIPPTAVVKINLGAIDISGTRPISNCLVPFACVDNDVNPALEMTLSDYTVSVRYAESPAEMWTRRSDIKTYHPSRPFKTPWCFNEQNWDEDTVHGSRHIYTTSGYFSHDGHLPLASLKAVFLTANALPSFHGPEGWISFFALARGVQRLSFAYPASINLLAALRRINDAQAPSLFPQLNTLILHADIDHYRGDGPSLHSALELSLLDVLATRQSCAAPIQRLFVTNELASWEVWGHVDRATTSVSFF